MLIFLPVSVLSLLLSLSFLVTVQVQAACQGDGGIISTIAGEDQVYSLASLSSGDIAAGYKNGKVKLFDQDTGDLIRDLPSHGPSKPVWGIAIIPFNGHIATVGEDKKILISDPMTGNLTTTITTTTAIASVVAFNDTVIVGGSKTISTYHVITGKKTASWTANTGFVYSLTLLKDGSIASGGEDKLVKIWDFSTRLLKKTLAGSTQTVYALAVLDDGTLCSGGADNYIRLWNTREGGDYSLDRSIFFGNDVFTLLPLPDGTLLCAGNTITMRIYDPTTGFEIRKVLGHTNLVRVAILSGNGNNNFITGSFDKSVKIWSPNGGYVLMSLEDHTDTVWALSVIDENSFVTASADKSLKVFDSFTGKCLNTIVTEYPVYDVVTLQNGNIASCGVEYKINIWNPVTGVKVKSVSTGGKSMMTLILLRNGKLAAGSYSDFKIRIFDINLSVPAIVQTLAPAHLDNVRSLVELTSSLGLVSGSWDKTVIVWTKSTPYSNYSLKKKLTFSYAVSGLVLMDGGSTLVVGGYDGTISLWNLVTYSLIKTLNGHTDSVKALLILPDNVLMSGSYDTTMRVWDVTSGNTTRVFTGHSGPIYDLAVQPTQTIMSASGDFSVKFWIRACDDGGAFCLTNKTTPILCSFEGFYCPSTHPRNLTATNPTSSPTSIPSSTPPTPSVILNSTGVDNSTSPPPPGVIAPVIVKPVECVEGFFCPAFSIVPTPCAKGTFSSSKRRGTPCDACGSGDYCREGSTAKELCPSSFYCPTPSQMYHCSPGFHCPNGTVNPIMCEAGSYCDGSGEKRLCRDGYFCTEGAPSEKKCSSGFYCGEGSSSQTMCEAGKYCDGSGLMRNCTRGFYCTAGTPNEIECSVGQYCGENTVLPSACPIGYYCSSPNVTRLCRAGSYCNYGSTSEELCEKGFVCPTPSVKIACEVGSYCDAGSMEERPCPAKFNCPKPRTIYPCGDQGSYCPEGSREEAKCEGGFYCPDSGTKLVCEKGHTCKKGSRDGRPCPLGTYNPKMGSIDESSCLPCPSTRTTVSEASRSVSMCVCKESHYIGEGGECVECTAGLICDSIALKLEEVRAGDDYYSVPMGTSSIASLQCLIPGACRNSTCSEGYRGFLCNSCEEGYFKTSLSSVEACVSCAVNIVRTLLEVSGFTTIGICLLSYIINVKLRKSEDIIGSGMRESGMEGRMRANQQQTAYSFGILQRMFLNHIQLLSIIFSFDFRWPPEVVSFMSSMNVLSFAGVSGSFGGGMKCVFYVQSLPDSLNELLLMLYILSACTVIIPLFWMAKAHYRSRNQISSGQTSGNGSGSTSTGQKITVSLVALYYLMYSTLIRLYFGLFACTSFAFDDQYRLKGSLDTLCGGSSHLKYVFYTLPVVLVLVIGLPVLAFLKLYKANRVLALSVNPQMMASYGFIFEGYKREYWYWEIVNVGRKMLLSGISVFLSSKSPDKFERNLQGYAAVLVVMVFLLVQTKCKPYRDDTLNTLEEVGLIVGGISLYMGYFTFLPGYQGAVSVIIVSLNCLWGAYVMYMASRRSPICVKARNWCCRRRNTTASDLPEIEMPAS